MIDTDTIEKYILGGEWENQYPQVIEELLAEVKRLREGIKQLIVKVEGMSTGYRKPIVKALKEMIE